MWKGICCFWILILNFISTEQSHFKGASVTWRPGRIFEDENKTEIVADFRIVWKRLSNQYDSTYCNDTTIANGGLLGAGDSTYWWECISGCNVNRPEFDAACIQYDEEDDWSLGAGTAYFNITGDGEFEIRLQGCCWINTLVYVSNKIEEWSIDVKGNVALRSDTRLPNRSPIATATPVIRFQAGCPNFVDLLVHDEDGDIVTCRSAECPQSSCTFHPYLKLTQQGDICRLSYNGGGPGDIRVAISLILEDYPRMNLQIGGILQNTTDKLSTSEIQFLVYVYTDARACGQKPVWVNGTFANGLVKSMTTEQEARIDLFMQSTTGISSITVVGAQGIARGSLLGPNEDNEYSTQLAFTPTLDQIGDHVVCVTAKDNDGKMSEQRCMVIKVGDKVPCEIANGGCADQCITAGESYHCECKKDCWQLADDKRTCIPAIEVRCMPDRFSFELPSCALPEQILQIGYGDGSDEKASCQATNNGSYYTKEFLYEDCSTQTKSDFIEIHYINKVKMWVDPASEGSGDLVTRGHFYNMQLVCSFNKYANVNASFRPQDREENLIQVPGLGSFQFFFDFYIDEQFGATYSPYEYPITVTVNSDIYFGIRTVGGAGLEVFTEKCVAMTTSSLAEDTLSYTMIENGCIEDNTMVKYTTANKMEDHFSIKAFRFQDNLNTDSEVNIYIQCSAVLCVVGEETRCQKGCIRTRKRRDGQNEILVDRLHKRSVDEEESPTSSTNVSESNILEITVSGPFRIEVQKLSGTQLVTVVTPTEPPKDDGPKEFDDKKGDENGDSGMILIIASSIGGSFFLILLLTVAVLCAYYHLILKSKHKILPDDLSTRSPSPNAWTEEWENMRNNYLKIKAPETPPPSFWDVQSIR